MIGPAEFLLAGLLPAVVAFAIRQALSRVGVSASVGCAWSVAIGFVAGQIGLGARVGLADREGLAATVTGWTTAIPSASAAFATPHVARDWLPAAALAAAVLATLGAGRGAARWIALIGAVAIVVALPTRLLWGSVYFVSQWSTGQAAITVGAWALALLAVGLLASMSEGKQDSGAAVPVADAWTRVLLTGVTLVGVAVTLMLSGSQSYGELAGALAAAAGGTLLGGLGVAPPSRWPIGFAAAGAPITLIAGALLIVGVSFAELRPTNAVLLAVAAAVAQKWAPRSVRDRPWLAVIGRTAVCLTPLVIAISIAASDFAAATAAEQDNPYLNWQPAE